MSWRVTSRSSISWMTYLGMPGRTFSALRLLDMAFMRRCVFSVRVTNSGTPCKQQTSFTHSHRLLCFALVLGLRCITAENMQKPCAPGGGQDRCGCHWDGKAALVSLRRLLVSQMPIRRALHLVGALHAGGGHAPQGRARCCDVLSCDDVCGQQIVLPEPQRLAGLQGEDVIEHAHQSVA